MKICQLIAWNSLINDVIIFIVLCTGTVYWYCLIVVMSFKSLTWNVELREMWTWILTDVKLWSESLTLSRLSNYCSLLSFWMDHIMYQNCNNASLCVIFFLRIWWNSLVWLALTHVRENVSVDILTCWWSSTCSGLTEQDRFTCTARIKSASLQWFDSNTTRFGDYIFILMIWIYIIEFSC